MRNVMEALRVLPACLCLFAVDIFIHIITEDIMRKKNILGNFVERPDVLCIHSILKLEGETEIYSALITFLPKTRELQTEIGGKQIVLAGDGYKWLMYLPINKCWCLSTYYTPANELVGWYFDISKNNFVDENGMPCIDDIFLDLAISSSGEITTLDADELREALDKKEISIQDYDHAYKVHDQILNSYWSDTGFLARLSEKLISLY